ncbi:hypothetical protein G7K_1692-t1 [Saitoella complicata NRRL Y-17804]|uniref:Uncharacterized protein n=1 Tax=Saitoella complicata (strain BCRC 22490 / CBS 7301 / JCM 7358 / NBRC 10748 / NRRL Y-17804) TaxID=698492 RepID=A0A0E9NCR2_SAICN|nr:hypothetical protein G7K_1692-t1 [Saitoella complicata NRRL Y-17804]
MLSYTTFHTILVSLPRPKMPIHDRNVNNDFLLHVNDTTDARARVHDVESVVDLSQGLVVGDELVNHELLPHVSIDDLGQLSTALDTTESRSPPDTSSNELEWAGRDLLSSSSDTDNDGLSPSLVASLQSAPHNVDVTSAVEGVVTSTISHLDQFVNDGLVTQLGRVNEVSGTELLGPLLLVVVGVNSDDAASALGNSTLDNGKTDTSNSENSDRSAFFDLSSAGRSTVSSSNTTSQQTDLVQRRRRVDSDDRNIGNDGVLGESRGTHVVQDILTTGTEAGGTVGHDTLTLGSTDFTTEVGLSGLAELAFTAFGGVEGDDEVSGLDVGDALTDGLNDSSTFVTAVELSSVMFHQNEEQ